MMKREHGEACGCEHGASYSGESLTLWMKRCNTHEAAPALLEALERLLIWRQNLAPEELVVSARRAIAQARGFEGDKK